MNSSSDDLPIAVLGAGLTGLGAAYRLGKTGHQVRLFEKNEHVGGVVDSERVDGWLIERGPNSLQLNKAARALIEELDLTKEMVSSEDSAKKRFVVRGGAPRPLPMSPPGFLLSGFFSLKTKLALFKEMQMKSRERKGDVSLQTFVGDHFGQEMVDYALNPFIAGIFAGDPSRLSTGHAFPMLLELERKFGSIIKGQIKSAKAKRKPGEKRQGPPPIISFREGLAALPRRLAEKLPAGSLQLNARVERLQRNENGTWSVIWRDQEGVVTEERFSKIILALPLRALEKLSIGSEPTCPLESLSSVVCPPVTSVFLGYAREQVAHPLDGFGALFPEREKHSLLGVLFSSSLFPGRAPAGHVALTAMIGGTRAPILASLPEDELLDIISHDLKKVLGVKGAPKFLRINRWKHAIPQYDIGYDSVLDELKRFEAQNPGLYLAGPVRDGISMSAALASGNSVAEKIVSVA